MVIDRDGSASIDGEPVPLVPGEPVDVAVLDTLHGYARGRDAAVTAAISDLSTDSVSVVEVRPDGSSTLREELRADEPGEPGEPAVPDGLEAPDALTAPAERDESDQDTDAPVAGALPAPGPGGFLGALPSLGRDERDEEDAEPLKGKRSGKPWSAPFALPAVRVGNPFRRGGGPQSDDEYERPNLFERPKVAGGVAIGVVALVIGSLVAVATTGSGDDGRENGAADSAGEKGEHRLDPQDPRNKGGPSPSDRSSPPYLGTSQAEKNRSDSDSDSEDGGSKGSKGSEGSEGNEGSKGGDGGGGGNGSDSTDSDDDAEPTPDDDADSPPKGSPKSGDGRGTLLIRNVKFNTCLDLPGLGKGKPDGRVQDSRVCDSSRHGNQNWAMTNSPDRGDRGRKLHAFRNVKDNLCLDLPYYGSAKAKTGVTEYHCDNTNSDNQLWWLQKRPNGSFWIRNHKSRDMCLDLARTSKRPKHAGVLIVPCNAGDDHEWRFVKS
ncbi:RICIN domain-containing protein [Streptomyces sp. NPDC048172]|uniref:RICIN domain-containing protein n=1 Tax=Streptomyces sp. NPDC048172 TaxID=3365505 RepID=UPI0037218580